MTQEEALGPKHLLTERQSHPRLSWAGHWAWRSLYLRLSVLRTYTEFHLTIPTAVSSFCRPGLRTLEPQHETGVPGLDALRWLPGKVLHPYRISTCFRSEILIFHELFWESEVLSNPALASTRSRCTQTSGSISHMPPACQLEKAEAAEQSLWEMCPQQNQASPRQPGSICMQSTLK